MISIEELTGQVAPNLTGNRRSVVRWDDSHVARSKREERARAKWMETRRRKLEMALAAEKAKLAGVEARIRKIMAEFAKVQR